jgi:hypothetical protein
MMRSADNMNIRGASMRAGVSVPWLVAVPVVIDAIRLKVRRITQAEHKRRLAGTAGSVVASKICGSSGATVGFVVGGAPGAVLGWIAGTVYGARKGNTLGRSVADL